MGRPQLRYRTGGVPDVVDDATGRVLWRERDVHAARVKCLHLLQSSAGGDRDDASGATTVASGGHVNGDGPPGDRLVASGSYDATVRLWRVRVTRRVVAAAAAAGDGSDDDVDAREAFVCWQSCVGHSDSVTALSSLWLRPSDAGDVPDDNDDDDGAVNAQGEREYLVSASEDKTLRLWRVRWPSRHHHHHQQHRWTAPTVGSVRSFVGHSHGVFSVAGLPEAMLASGSWDRSVRLWDALTGDCLRVLHGHDKTALCLAWSASVSRLVSGGADKTLRVWDLAADDAGPVATLTGHSDAVTAVRFLVDDATATATEPQLQRQRQGHVVSSSLDKTLRLWDVAAGTCLRELRGHRQVVLCVAPLRQGAYVVSGDLRGDYCVWNTATGAQETQLSPPSESPSSSYADAVVCVDDGGGHLVTSGDDHRLRLWLPVA
jgi:WD40 repeat protein